MSVSFSYKTVLHNSNYIYSTKSRHIYLLNNNSWIFLLLTNWVSRTIRWISHCSVHLLLVASFPSRYVIYITNYDNVTYETMTRKITFFSKPRINIQIFRRKFLFHFNLKTFSLLQHNFFSMKRFLWILALFDIIFSCG